MTDLKNRLAAVAFASLGLAAYPVAAQGEISALTIVCNGPAETREIRVVAPGRRGKACDVVYSRNNGNTTSTPYYADSDLNFCFEKAKDLRSKLSASNYGCVGETLGGAASAEPAPQPLAAAPGPARKTPSQADRQAQTRAAEQESAPAPADSLETRDAFLAAMKAEAGQASEEPASALRAGDEVRAQIIPDTPAGTTSPVAQRGPTSLTVDIPPESAPASARSAPVVNRRDRTKLVGAVPTTLAAAQTSAPPPVEPKVAPPTRQAAPNPVQRLASVLTPAPADRPRTRPEIIKATLAAQAAAWNEGDIEAFMEGYWRDDALRFVSGTEISSGWNATLRRYKRRYGNGAALGTLTFDDLDVEMITEDVAVVVGRFNLQRQAQFNTGIFSLVMKQIDGAWRIVHDHTVADQPAGTATQAAAATPE